MIFINNGFNNEYEIVNAINGSKFIDLPIFLKYVVKYIFKNVSDKDIFYSRLCERTSKPDISIKWNDKIVYISIKSGKSDSIHFEKINDFIDYLNTRNISKETQETIKLFHYGDGTTDGSGQRRMWFDELFPLLSERIKVANDELNSFGIREDLIDRFLFNGIEAKKISVDYILFGNSEYGLICSKENVRKFLLRKNYNHISTLHVGPFTLQPFLRDVNRISKNIYKREYIQVKWHYMLSDLQYINKYYKDN